MRNSEIIDPKLYNSEAERTVQGTDDKGEISEIEKPRTNPVSPVKRRRRCDFGSARDGLIGQI